MPKGVIKKNKKEITNLKTAKSKNDTQSILNTNDDKEKTDTITEGETTKKNSEEQSNLPSSTDPHNDKSDPKKISEGDQGRIPSDKDPLSDLDFFIEDVRGSIKESNLIDSSSQILPGSPYQKNKKLPKFIQNIDNWMYGKVRNPFSPYQHVTGTEKKKRSPIRIFFVIFLLVCLGYLLVLAGNSLNNLTPNTIPTNTPVPTISIPIPNSVQFPGGWKIFLGVSNTAFSDWKPTQAEWYKDTTICKLIAIPWTKQIDAVYQTLNEGEKLILTMTNKDESIYQIETLEISPVENLIEKLEKYKPCMIIFLYSESTLTTQVLITIPVIP